MIKNITIDQLVPHPMNPRKDLGDLSELSDSIKAQGVLQNLTVVANEDLLDSYTVIIGHRRLEAAKLAGLNELPCVVVELEEKAQVSMMLLENMQRSDLTPYEQAQGFQQCLELGITVQELSQSTGFSKKTVKHRLKMLELDQEKVKVAQGTIEDYIALEQIEDAAIRNSLLKHMGTNNFNIEVEKAKAKNTKQETAIANDEENEDLEDPIVVISYNLRKNFMREVFKKKIEKEELADSVFTVTELLLINNFNLKGNKQLFHEIANPNNLSYDELRARIISHRINFFVVANYCLLENEGNLLKLYEFLEVLKYKPSDAEKEMIQNAQNSK